MNRSWCSWFCSCWRRVLRHRGRGGGTHAVLRMSGCTLYSFAKTKGTMPWGRAACSFRHFAKQENKQAEHGERKKKAKLLCWPPRRRERESEKERGEHERGPGKEAAQRGCLAAGRARAAAKDFSPLRVHPSPLPLFPTQSTWTMATCRSVPRRPTAKDAAAITAGPVRKRTAMANVATLFPHAMIRGCSAMNSPARNAPEQSISTVGSE